MGRVKLDSYDYTLIHTAGRLTEVHVHVDSSKDAQIGDISTELNVNNNKLYVEGHYGKALDIIVSSCHQGSMMIIYVEEDYEKSQTSHFETNQET